MQPQITAIVVNHNRGELLRRTVDSLRTQTVALEEILIVDNGSTDGSLEFVRNLPRVRIIPLGENTGASGGFHHGLRCAMETAASEFVIVDSDVRLAENCVERIKAVLTGKPDTGAAGPKVYNWDSTTVLQEFGGWVDWESGDLRRSHWRFDEAIDGPLSTDQEVDYVPACCLMTTRRAIEAAGNFDPAWFLYWDDVDWCARVRRSGMKVRAVAAATVQHFGGGANKRSLVPVYYGWRNRLAFFARMAPPAKRAASLQALLEDFLLARFTCRSFGLAQTIAMMDRGVEDALRGISGRREFSPEEIALDPSSNAESGPWSDERSKVRRVVHVIGSATRELAEQPDIVLEDRFGKRMPAERAYELREQFEATRDDRLGPLLQRAFAIGR